MEISNPEGGEPPQQALLLLFNLAAIQPSTGVIVACIVVLFLFMASALMSGSEVAFFSLSARDIDDIDQQQENTSERILNLLSKPRYLLATILIANNLVNVSIIVLSYFILTSLLDADIYGQLIAMLQVGVLTILLVLFGEVIPKVYATKYSLRIAVLMSAPLLVLRSIFQPFSAVLVKSGSYLERRLKRNSNSDFNPDELEMAIDLTSGHRTNDDEIKMLKGIVKFGNIQVKQIMRSRMDMVAVELDTNFSELIATIQDAGYSRIPVYKENLDHIEGILYVKDLLSYLDKDDDFKWQTLIRQANFVPAAKKIDDLLKEMQEMRVHLVVAVDEYGGTAGVVTLEDILEEVIGEIKDEYDLLEEIHYEKLDSHNYIFEGRTMIQDMCKVLNIREDTFAEARGDADSLAGLVLEMAGQIPDEGTMLTYDRYKFTVITVSTNRIEKIKITIHEDALQGS